MALRPLAFGVRLRSKGRTLRVQQSKRDARRYVVEESRSGSATRRRAHATLGSALRDLAQSWRNRLH